MLMVKDFLESNFNEDEIKKIKFIMSQINFNVETGEAPQYLSAKFMKLNDSGHSWIEIFQGIADKHIDLQRCLNKIEPDNLVHKINSLCYVLKNYLESQKIVNVRVF